MVGGGWGGWGGGTGGVQGEHVYPMIFFENPKADAPPGASPYLKMKLPHLKSKAPFQEKIPRKKIRNCH